MLGYVLRRMLVMIPTVIIISMVSFALIKLPPGDFLTSYVASLEAGGESVDECHAGRTRTALRAESAGLHAVLEVDHGHRPAR